MQTKYKRSRYQSNLMTDDMCVKRQDWALFAVSGPTAADCWVLSCPLLTLLHCFLPLLLTVYLFECCYHRRHRLGAWWYTAVFGLQNVTLDTTCTTTELMAAAVALEPWILWVQRVFVQNCDGLPLNAFTLGRHACLQCDSTHGSSPLPGNSRKSAKSALFGCFWGSTYFWRIFHVSSFFLEIWRILGIRGPILTYPVTMPCTMFRGTNSCSVVSKTMASILSTSLLNRRR